MDYTFKLTQEQVNIIGHGLGELPFKTAAPVINAINAQLQEQSVEKPQSPEPE